MRWFILQEEKQKNKYSSNRGFKKLFLLLIFFLLVFAFRTYLIDRVIVNGVSMQPTFYENDVCWVDKTGINDISRYDIVIVKLENINAIKRVIGLPNDTINISDNTVFINDKKIDSDYDFEISVDEDITVTLGADEYYILGDNRNQSYDSTEIGTIKKEEILGIVFFRFYPFDKISVIPHGEE